jgi:uncharacterized 2Fe-2S/4Fe-4S cluster protein (DUF4445 family)
LKIDFQPLGKRVEVSESSTVLESAHQAGIDLAAVCGGSGTCGVCKIRLAAGELSLITKEEENELGENGVQKGYRLACQAFPRSDCTIEIPPESLTAQQRTQIEGVESVIEIDTDFERIVIAASETEITELIADDIRILTNIQDAGINQSVKIPHSVLEELSNSLRKQSWSGSFMISNRVPVELTAFLPQNARMLGLAGDLGSTKLAIYLVDLESGEIVSKAGAINPQISYGEDVVSRIAYSNKHPDGRKTLQSRLVDSINDMVLDLCNQTDTKPEWIIDCVMVGNTAMHHFFAGLPVEQLGIAPYLPAVGSQIQFPCREVGLRCAPGASVYMPPNLAGFVGADHVAMLLAADSWRGNKTILSMDIGTNTEVSLLADGKLYSCSCASGPAFEGAHIHSGMRAAPGAIERVQINEGRVYWQTIDGKPPIGICGSGILEAISEMKNAGIIDDRGVFIRTSPLVDMTNGKGRFILVPASLTANSEDIIVSRGDINQIQLAKAAIRAAVEILLQEAKIMSSEIDDFIIAGAFGTYLDVSHSISIGMFPDIPLDRFSQIGNAAGVGARQLLLSNKKRGNAIEIAGKINYVELTTHPQFTQQYLDAMYIRKG